MSEKKEANQFRVLVLSGKSHEREIYIEQFNAWDCDVCATGSLSEACGVINALAQLNVAIDLIVMDQDHADQGQLGLVQTVREKFSSDETKIIAIGAEEFQTYCEAQFANELQELLVKPCAPSKLEGIVNQIIEAHRAPEGDAREKGSATSVGYGLDVLVAEDNEVNQIVFTEILEDLDVSFKIAKNGEEAVQLWKDCNPALILMDVSMPVMNGHEATREIRRLEAAEKKNRTPICAITAHALKGDKEDCFAAGMDDYLSKPISPDMLTDKVKVMLPSDHPKSQPMASTVAA